MRLFEDTDRTVIEMLDMLRARPMTRCELAHELPARQYWVSLMLERLAGAGEVKQCAPELWRDCEQCGRGMITWEAI